MAIDSEQEIMVIICLMLLDAAWETINQAQREVGSMIYRFIQ